VDRKRDDMQDFYRCYNDAESLYLAGVELPEIATRLGVAIERLVRWFDEYQWTQRRRALMEVPRGVGAMLREQLRRQVEAQMGPEKLLAIKNVEEIARLTKLIANIEGEGAPKEAATIEVMREFSAYVRKEAPDREEFYLLASYIQNYLRTQINA